MAFLWHILLEKGVKCENTSNVEKWGTTDARPPGFDAPVLNPHLHDVFLFYIRFIFIHFIKDGPPFQGLYGIF